MPSPESEKPTFLPSASSINDVMSDLLRESLHEGLALTRSAWINGEISNSERDVRVVELGTNFSKRADVVLRDQSIQELLGNVRLSKDEMVEAMRQVWTLQRELAHKVERLEKFGETPCEAARVALGRSQDLITQAFADSDLRQLAFEQVIEPLRNDVARMRSNLARHILNKVSAPGVSIYNYIGSGWGTEARYQANEDGSFTVLVGLQTREGDGRDPKEILNRIGTVLSREVSDFVRLNSDLQMTVELDRELSLEAAHTPVPLHNPKSSVNALNTEGRFTVWVGREYFS